MVQARPNHQTPKGESAAKSCAKQNRLPSYRTSALAEQDLWQVELQRRQADLALSAGYDIDHGIDKFAYRSANFQSLCR